MVVATRMGLAVSTGGQGSRVRDRGPGAGLWSRCRLSALAVCLIVAVLPTGASAEDYFTLVVSGASGDPRYVETYDRWRQTLIASLRSRPEFREEHLLVLADTPRPGVGRASREGVRQAFDLLRARMTDDSIASIVLFGHGTFDGVDAKFNLVGPDLGADEWRRLLETLPGAVVFINTTAASFPFLTRVAGARRVVVTATESSAQQYDTMFPEFLVQAFEEEEAADVDRNGRLSILEVFEFASAEVRRWYQRQGRLATERARLDDTGDGIGREADETGPDGPLAARLHVGAGVETAIGVTDPSLAPLVTRRRQLEDEVADLKARKTEMAPDAYLDALERLLVDLARVSRDLRRGMAPS